MIEGIGAGRAHSTRRATRAKARRPCG